MTDLVEFKKALYEVKIIKVPEGLCIYNKLDNSNCMTSSERSYVVVGLKGEQWPIREKDLKKYLNLDGSAIDAVIWELGEEKTVKTNTDGPHILVYFPEETETFAAPASWKMTEPLVAKVGDAVAYTMKEDGTPDLNDKYVIDSLVFERTYVEA